MDKFQKKYGFIENEKTIAFHKSRRMFAIYQDKLRVAEPNLPYSHAVWFEKEGWLTKEDDKLMDSIIRGYAEDNGDIYFYVGYNFEVNAEVESIFFSYLKELVEKLHAKPDSRIFGGLIKQESGKWPPRKEYGKISDNL